MTVITYARDHEALEELRSALPDDAEPSPDELRTLARHHERLAKCAMDEAGWVEACQ